MNSCEPDSCPEFKKCNSLNGYDFECVFECEGNPCCENGPNPLCCLNNGVCSNENFVYNGTNSDECQCNCNDSFTGKQFGFIYNSKMVIKVMTVPKIDVKTSVARMDTVMPEVVPVMMDI